MSVVTRTLYIGDGHAHPNYDNDRFELAGRWAVANAVDYIHYAGDHSDNPSLNSHKSMLEARKGSTYEQDLEAGADALARLDEGLDGYPVKKSVTLGNHDHYPNRFVANEAPELEGTMCWSDVPWKKHGWKVLPFPDVSNYRGFHLSHYFTPPQSARPYGGKYAVKRHLERAKLNCYSGHSHKYDHSKKDFRRGGSIHAWVGGCWVHPKYVEPWCVNSVETWDVGLLVVETDSKHRVLGWKWTKEELVRRKLGK